MLKEYKDLIENSILDEDMIKSLYQIWEDDVDLSDDDKQELVQYIIDLIIPIIRDSSDTNKPIDILVTALCKIKPKKKLK